MRAPRKRQSFLWQDFEDLPVHDLEIAIANERIRRPLFEVALYSRAVNVLLCEIAVRQPLPHFVRRGTDVDLVLVLQLLLAHDATSVKRQLLRRWRDADPSSAIVPNVGTTFDQRKIDSLIPRPSSERLYPPVALEAPASGVCRGSGGWYGACVDRADLDGHFVNQ
jgi:hypothetical protein